MHDLDTWNEPEARRVALLAWGEKFGTTPRTLELLRFGSNGVYTDRKRVIRVAPKSFDVDIGYWYAKAAAERCHPVLAPLGGEPFQEAGHGITFWPFIDANGFKPVDWYRLGKSLRLMHGDSKTINARMQRHHAIPPDLQYAQLTKVQERIGWFRSHGHLDADQYKALIRVSEQVEESWPDDISTVVHGDMYVDNIIPVHDSDQQLLIDFDAVSRGPAAWDLALTCVQERYFRAPLGRMDQLVDGYGSDPRGEETFETMVRSRALSATTFALQLAVTASWAAKTEVEKRLDYWTTGRFSEPWQSL